MFTGKEGESIPLATASAWTQNYRNANPDGKKAIFYGKDILKQILAQSDCMGLRIYFAIDDEGAQQLVIVGADSSENDQYTQTIAEKGLPCPVFCGGGGSPLQG
jgi:hypothetical protein